MYTIEFNAWWEEERVKLIRIYGEKYFWIGTLRGMRTLRERRYAADSEHKHFIRGRRRHLPEPWGTEIPIRWQKNWKSRSKASRQWMANQKAHISTRNVVCFKRVEFNLLCDDEENFAGWWDMGLPEIK